GNDPDWFKLTVKAWYNGTLKNAAVDFYLADYRFSNNTQDYIVRDWRWVDLTSLGNVDSLAFFLSSSDTGSFGMNTPAYYCIDNFTTADRANGGPTVADGNITITYSQDTLINVIGQYVTDTSGEALTVQIISGPLISGASAVVDSNNNIWYLPNIGIVAVDTITYSVCDIDNHCDTAQLFINITGLEGINDIAKLNAAVWPNPFNASLSVATKQGVDELSLYDLTGRLIMQERHPQSTAPIMLNTASLPAGLYLLKVIVGNSVATVKVTKQ
ncbi:MAG TPA: DUF4465 domain-containing protein, partial [Chitinophagales bacterium]|nr:DUF4465 domain-containing protein [Chitinophagales bacterium]